MQAKLIEIELIAKCRKYGWKLYNLSGGGDGVLGVRRNNYKPSKESIEKRRQSLLGKKFSDEHKRHISEGRKGKFKGKDNPNWGRHMSEENKQKLRLTHTGENNFNWGKAGMDITSSKRVCQYTLKNEFIKEYPSISEASRQTGVCLSCISKCCKNEQKQSGGYIWKFKNIKREEDEYE